MVRLAALSKKFVKGKETIPIFDHLDIAISRGDFVAVMGPSGSGKTTLLNLLGGIDRADAGEIHVAGQRIDALSEGELARFRAANVGFIFQFYNLMPMLTAAQNVELPLLLTKLGRKDRAKRVETALAVVNLADRMNSLPVQIYTDVGSPNDQLVQRAAEARHEPARRGIASGVLRIQVAGPGGDAHRGTPWPFFDPVS